MLSSYERVESRTASRDSRDSVEHELLAHERPAPPRWRCLVTVVSLLTVTLLGCTALWLATHGVAPQRASTATDGYARSAHTMSVFLRIGSLDESTAWRRSLARTHYLEHLEPLRDYAFVLQRAASSELGRFRDVVLVPSGLLSRCSTISCRYGITLAYGLRWATENTTRAFILSVDDDGFLCVPQLSAMVRLLPVSGVVLGTWHESPARPDQHFMLVSRDVATTAAGHYMRMHADRPQQWSLTIAERAYLSKLPHRYDVREAALHPAHNARALWYQQPSAEAAATFCERHVWLHFCCRSANTSSHEQSWHALQRGAHRVAGGGANAAGPRDPVPKGRLPVWLVPLRPSQKSPVPVPCGQTQATSCAVCSTKMPQLPTKILGAGKGLTW